MPTVRQSRAGSRSWCPWYHGPSHSSVAVRALVVIVRAMSGRWLSRLALSGVGTAKIRARDVGGTRACLSGRARTAKGRWLQQQQAVGTNCATKAAVRWRSTTSTGRSGLLVSCKVVFETLLSSHCYNHCSCLAIPMQWTAAEYCSCGRRCRDQRNALPTGPYRRCRQEIICSRTPTTTAPASNYMYPSRQTLLQRLTYPVCCQRGRAAVEVVVASLLSPLVMWKHG